MGYNIIEVVTNGDVRKYKIGEIAKLAGVSKRTIDYYTNLGLLRPLRSDNNYRYYTGDTLVRMKLIETMKLGRFTLEEIKDYLDCWDKACLPEETRTLEAGKINVDVLRMQLKQLESQLVQLQSGGSAAMDEAGVAQLRNRIMVQSMALFQSLMIYLNEIYAYL